MRPLMMLLLLAFVGGTKAQETLTVYDGTDQYLVVPMNINTFCEYTRSQYVIPAKDLTGMTGGTISSITYYTESNKVPYTTDTDVKVYLKEVDYIKMSAFETVSDGNLVYQGKVSVAKSGNGGTALITLNTPYKYKGGNLLISTENTDKQKGYKSICFYGKKGLTSGVSVSGTDSNSPDNISAKKKDFIPKTTFTYTFAPTITKVETSPSSATLSWTGKNDSYQLRYGKVEFFDDFENGLDKWKVVRKGEGVTYSDWYWKTGSFNDNVAPHSGTHTAVSRSWADEAYHVDNWLISPKVTLGGVLSFWVRDDGKYHEHYDVYVSTTTDDISSFKQLASPGNASAVWTEVSIDLSKYEGQTGYFAIRNQDYDQNYLQIDDIGIYPENNSWTVMNNATSPSLMDNLDAGSVYGIQVKGVYSNGTATPWASVGCLTEANPIPYDVAVTSVDAHSAALSWKGYGDSYEVRYRTGAIHIIRYQGFENGYDGWTLQNCHDKTHGYASAAHSGNYGFAFHYTTTPPQYLISPRIPDTTDGTKLQFYYMCHNSTYPESFTVGYSTTTNDIAAFKFGDEITTNSGWAVFNEDVPADIKYICIKCTSDDRDHLFIDDIVVYKPAAAGDWQTITGITGTSATIAGLQADTEYEFQIRSIKTSKDGEGVSEWNELKNLKTSQENLTLRDNDAAATVKNLDIISSYDKQEVNVTLSGHTFYKDGCWNTVCLPFDVAISGSPLDGATAKELTKAEIEGTTLKLTFSNPVLTLQAGKPYIIKWNNDTEHPTIANPTFTGVTIDKTIRSYDNGVSGNGRVSFAGQYAPFEIVANATVLGENQGHLNEIILLTSGDKIGYSTDVRTIANGKALHGFGAHFFVPATGSNAGTRSIHVDYGDGTTGISATLTDHDPMSQNGEARVGWYTLSGQRIDQPTRKGAYIHNGKTVIIK
jgi:hypothetical protein